MSAPGGPQQGSASGARSQELPQAGRRGGVSPPGATPALDQQQQRPAAGLRDRLRASSVPIAPLDLGGVAGRPRSASLELVEIMASETSPSWDGRAAATKSGGPAGFSARSLVRALTYPRRRDDDAADGSNDREGEKSEKLEVEGLRGRSTAHIKRASTSLRLTAEDEAELRAQAQSGVSLQRVVVIGGRVALVG